MNSFGQGYGYEYHSSKEGERLLRECRRRACGEGAVEPADLDLPEPTGFKAVPGRGVEATVLGCRVHIGSLTT